MWAFPPTGFEIKRFEYVSASFDGPRGDVSSCRPLLSGVHDAVGLVEMFLSARLDVMNVALLWVEASDVGAMWVSQMRVTVSHPFGY